MFETDAVVVVVFQNYLFLQHISERLEFVIKAALKIMNNLKDFFFFFFSSRKKASVLLFRPACHRATMAAALPLREIWSELERTFRYSSSKHDRYSNPANERVGIPCKRLNGLDDDDDDDEMTKSELRSLIHMCKYKNSRPSGGLLNQNGWA